MTTDEERYFVAGGRRWRRSDPAIPDTFRSELVAELMDARRAVGAAQRVNDADGLAAARRRVRDAKVALGERGAPWWEEPSPDERAERIGATIRALLRHRRPWPDPPGASGAEVRLTIGVRDRAKRFTLETYTERLYALRSSFGTE